MNVTHKDSRRKERITVVKSTSDVEYYDFNKKKTY